MNKYLTTRPVLGQSCGRKLSLKLSLILVVQLEELRQSWSYPRESSDVKNQC